MYKAIVAIDKSRVMWDSNLNELLWRFSEDLKWFKKNTIWQNIIMGRKTWDSLPDNIKPLADRVNIILSKTSKTIPWVIIYSDLDMLMKDYPDGVIIWWAEIFKLFSQKNLINEVLITYIEGTRDGDIILPYIEKDMKMISQQTIQDINKKSKYKEIYTLRFTLYSN